MYQFSAPRNSAVQKWIFTASGLVAGIIAVGGITRLTNSGLSMVDWSVIHFKPPANDEEWELYFEKYKKFPEYKL
jgi:cytochrome c oxidase assembly protein subunit 15